MKNNVFYKSGLNSEFTSENLNFKTYVNQMRAIIETTRLDLNEENRETIIDANSPFEWIPDHPTAKNPHSKKFINGVLLVHGLFDSPNTLWSIAEYFRKQHFLVRTLLLPGHGTNPGDLLDVSYQEWIKATKFGIESFANDTENLFLCGFSTGGALVLHQVLTEKIQNLKGLILFAPALKLQTPIEILSNFDNLLHQTIGGIKWLTRSATPDYARYLSFTLHSAYQVHILAQIITNLLESHPVITVPLFLVATADDEVLSVKTMQQFFSHQNEIENIFILYGNALNKTNDQRIEIVPSHFPEKKILNLSHICLPIAPDHPHYGEKGDYQDLYYETESQQKLKNVSKDLFYGALTYANLKQHFMQRITYNPDFPHLLIKLDKFLHTLSS